MADNWVGCVHWRHIVWAIHRLSFAKILKNRQPKSPITSSVIGETELDRFELSADAGETARVAHDVDPPATGSEHRIVYLLYVGDAPDDPSREGAYRYVQLWTGDGGQQQLDAGGELRLDAGGR